jgi:hypothetical protein
MTTSVVVCLGVRSSRACFYSPFHCVSVRERENPTKHITFLSNCMCRGCQYLPVYIRELLSSLKKIKMIENYKEKTTNGVDLSRSLTDLRGSVWFVEYAPNWISSDHRKRPGFQIVFFHVLEASKCDFQVLENARAKVIIKPQLGRLTNGLGLCVGSRPSPIDRFLGFLCSKLARSLTTL